MVTGRTFAPGALEKGAYNVGIHDAEIGPIRINGVESQVNFLIVRVKVTNLAPQAVDFTGWHEAGKVCPLKDSLNFRYNMVKFASSGLPEGCVRRTRMEPQKRSMTSSCSTVRWR